MFGGGGAKGREERAEEGWSEECQTGKRFEVYNEVVRKGSQRR